MDRQKVGLALGTGAARGWAHIGVIEALLEAGIVPDIVCGTSMGALVGAAYASGRLEQMKAWALAADMRAVAQMVDIGFLAGGLVDGARIVDWLVGLKMPDRIEDTAIRFAAVATDLTTGREVWLRSGPLARSIRASIAMPGIFSPVHLDGAWLVDGGLVNPVPVSLCRALGASFVIAVNLNADILGHRLTPEPLPDRTPAQAPLPPGNLFEFIRSVPGSLRQQTASLNLFRRHGAAPSYVAVLANALNIMQDHITRSRLAGEPPHALIMPRVIDTLGLLDFHRAEVAIAEGRAATERALPSIIAGISA